MRIARLLPLALLLTLPACGPSPQAGMGGFPPPEVDVVTVQTQDVALRREYVGQTRGIREVEIRPRVSGIIEKRLYTEGAQVRAGQVLFQIDAAPYQAQLDAAEAALSSAQAQASQAEREFNRLQPLAAASAISAKEMDDASATRDIAQANLKNAQAKAREARLNLGWTRVVAPIAGYAGQAEKVEGALVSAATDRLTTLVQSEHIDIYFALPENDWLSQQKAMQSGHLQASSEALLAVEIKLADGTILQHKGELTSYAPAFDRDTGTLGLRLRVDNQDGQLKAGQSVRISFAGLSRPKAITLPQKAVLEGPQGKFVFVLAQDKGASVVQPRPVTAGEWVNTPRGREWVIVSGLQAGDKVVLNNLIKLYPGAPVKLATAAPAKAGGQ